MKPIMLDNQITLLRKFHYGNAFYYVLDNEKASHIQTLTGKKTVSENDIKALKALGFKLRLHQDSLPI
jgi:hypothetical protein